MQSMTDGPPAAADTVRLYHFTGAAWGLKTLWEKRLKVVRYDELNDPFELQPFERTSAAGEAAWEAAWEGRVAEVLGGEHGLLCFCDRWRDPRLWSQYAERHTGVCLGFDVSVAYAARIDYIDAPLPNPWADDAAALSVVPVDVVEAALRHKPSVWRHEREWRLRVRLGRPTDGLHYKHFDDDLHLREVILGPRCRLTTADVIDAVSSPPLDVDIFQADLAHDAHEVRKHALASTHTAPGFRAVLARARDVYAHELPDDDAQAD